MTTTGLINPGAMGASVGAAANRGDNRVIWASEGRSQNTRERAQRACLEDCVTLDELVKQSDIILSICPPHSAEEVAGFVAGRHFSGLFVEANAIAPDRTRRIEKTITSGGADFVDGGIIGGPAWEAGSGTRLYLSGKAAPAIAPLFERSPLEAIVISEKVGAASALKMSFAAYTKGSTALLTAILGVAEKEGVRGDLEAQWGEEFAGQTHRRVAANTAKAWRFEGEMQEIADTFEGAGLPGGFHRAAADVFGRLAQFKDSDTPEIEEVLRVLLGVAPK